MINRDSAVLVLGMAVGVLGYLATAGNPMDWSYEQWIQTAMATLVIVSAKLGNSPLRGEQSKAKPSSSVRLVLPFLLAATVAAGCATMGPRARIVTTHQGVQTLLASADDAERILCFGQVTLPAAPSVCTTPAAAQVGLTDERHRAIRRAFVKAYKAQIALGAVIETWTPGAPVDFSVLSAAVMEIDEQLALMDIKAPPIGRLIADVIRWKAEIEQLRKAFGGGL